MEKELMSPSYDFAAAKEEYRAFCHEGGHNIYIFQEPCWLDATAGPDNWGVALYKKDVKIVGFLLFCYHRYGKKIRIMDPTFTQFTGLWLDMPPTQKPEKRLAFEKEVITDLLEKMEMLPLISVSQAHSADIVNWQPLYWKGYQDTTHYSFRITDLTDVEKIEQSFSSAKRKNIKRARSLGLEIGFDLSADEFYSNHKMTLAKQGAEISYSRELFQKIYTTAYDHQCGRTIYAKDREGHLHGALFVIWNERCAFDLISTIDPDYRNSGAATLLVLEMIRYLSDKTRAFDFEGSMIEGVADSFAQFGARQLPYFNTQKVYDRRALFVSKVQNRLHILGGKTW